MSDVRGIAWVLGAAVSVLVVAGCAAPGEPPPSSPLADFLASLEPAQSAVTSSDGSAAASEAAEPSLQTVGSAQQLDGFNPLSEYVNLARDSDALGDADCRETSQSAASQLRAASPAEPALRLALIASCPVATARTLRLVREQLMQLVEPAAAAAGKRLPVGHASLAALRLADVERRLAVRERVARLRAALAERDAELLDQRKQTQRMAAESKKEAVARRLLQRDLVRGNEALAAAREKLEAVQRIEREVQEAGDAADVQTEWPEPPSLETGEGSENDAPSVSDEGTSSGTLNN